MRRRWIPLVVAAVVAVGSAVIVWFRRRQSKDGPLEDLTKDELYDRAKAADIPGRSDMSKDELIRALRSGS
jgi:hypothetical protein